MITKLLRCNGTNIDEPALKSPAESAKNSPLTIWLRKVLYMEKDCTESAGQRSKKCYYGEGNCHFRAQKSAISGETFAGACRGLFITMTRSRRLWNQVSSLCMCRLFEY